MFDINFNLQRSGLERCLCNLFKEFHDDHYNKHFLSNEIPYSALGAKYTYLARITNRNNDKFQSRNGKISFKKKTQWSSSSRFPKLKLHSLHSPKLPPHWFLILRNISSNYAEQSFYFLSYFLRIQFVDISNAIPTENVQEEAQIMLKEEKHKNVIKNYVLVWGASYTSLPKWRELLHHQINQTMRRVPPNRHSLMPKWCAATTKPSGNWEGGGGMELYKFVVAQAAS